MAICVITLRQTYCDYATVGGPVLNMLGKPYCHTHTHHNNIQQQQTKKHVSLIFGQTYEVLPHS